MCNAGRSFYGNELRVMAKKKSEEGTSDVDTQIIRDEAGPLCLWMTTTSRALTV